MLCRNRLLERLDRSQRQSTRCRTISELRHHRQHWARIALEQGQQKALLAPGPQLDLDVHLARRPEEVD